MAWIFEKRCVVLFKHPLCAIPYQGTHQAEINEGLGLGEGRELCLYCVGGQFKKRQTLTNIDKIMKVTTLRELNATADERDCIHKFLGHFSNWFKTSEQARKYLKKINTLDRTLDFEIPNGRTFRFNVETLISRTQLTFKCKFSKWERMKNYADAVEYMWVNIGENDNMMLIFIDKESYVLTINNISGEETVLDHLIDRVIEIAPKTY